MGKTNIIILCILGLFVIGGVIYYYNSNKAVEVKKENNSSGGEIATIMEGQSSANNNSQPTISNQNAYMAEVLDIRGPINKQIEELISKSKYSTLFEKDLMISDADKIKSDISSGIDRLNNLNISSELQGLNKNNIKSLELLNEAMDAYIAMQESDDQTEKQKQSELFSYKIEESNKAIESQVGSNTNSNSSSGNTNTELNVSDVLQ